MRMRAANCFDESPLCERIGEQHAQENTGWRLVEKGSNSPTYKDKQSNRRQGDKEHGPALSPRKDLHTANCCAEMVPELKEIVNAICAKVPKKWNQKAPPRRCFLNLLGGKSIDALLDELHGFVF